MKPSLLELLGRAYSSAVLGSLDADWRFFHVIAKGAKCPPSTVAVRLRTFEKAGIVEREMIHVNAVRYRLTSFGTRVRENVRTLEALEATRRG